MRPRFAVVATQLLAALSAQAVGFVLFNTGVDEAGNKLGAAALDPHWTIVADPGIVWPASPSLDNFRQANPFSITGGFVSGINTLDFVITDLGIPGGLNVSGLQGTASAMPEPATSAVWLAAGPGFVA